jgi:hypothetical protein
MTKEDKATLLKAAKLIFSGKESWSCRAIYHLDNPKLSDNYAHFYNRSPNDSWDLMEQEPDDKDRIGWRIMLLLWFREVGLEGIQ